MLNESTRLAINKHEGQMYGDIPYIFHLFEVYFLTKKYAKDEKVLALSLLHDIVEDTDIDLNEIKNISENLLTLVLHITKTNKETYIQSCAKFYATRLVKVCDRICNVNTCITNNSIPQFFKYYNERKLFRTLYKNLPYRLIITLEFKYLQGVLKFIILFFRNYFTF